MKLILGFYSLIVGYSLLCVARQMACAATKPGLPKRELFKLGKVLK